MLVLHVRLRCGPLSITTPMSVLANEFDVRSARAIEFGSCQSNFVTQEAMNGCKKLKIH